MVCAGFTPDREDVEITDLTPLCVEGRVIYTASFDPAMGRPRLGPAPDLPLTPVVPTPTAAPASLPDKRLFLIGVAAGVLAALALGPYNSNS